MVLKIWCSKCEKPCYLEKRMSSPEEEEEYLKNLRCPFGKEDHLLMKVV